MEEDRISVSRHILHLQAVKKYMDENKLTSLTQNDIDNLLNEGMGIDNSYVEENPSAGPSADLSSQSLSMNGFSDDDSDYVP